MEPILVGRYDAPGMAALLWLIQKATDPVPLADISSVYPGQIVAKQPERQSMISEFCRRLLSILLATVYSKIGQ